MRFEITQYYQLSIAQDQTSQTRCLEKPWRPSAIYAFVNRCFTWKLYSKLTRIEREKNKLALIIVHAFDDLLSTTHPKVTRKEREKAKIIVNLIIFGNLLAIFQRNRRR